MVRLERNAWSAWSEIRTDAALERAFAERECRCRPAVQSRARTVAESRRHHRGEADAVSRCSPAQLTLEALGRAYTPPDLERMMKIVSALAFPILLLVSTTVPLPAQVSVRALMTAAEFEGAGLSKSSEAELKALDAWLVKFRTAVMSTSKNNATTAGTPSDFSIEDLEGSIVVASDGQALGLITTNCFNAKSLCNEFGKYGNNSMAGQYTTNLGSTAQIILDSLLLTSTVVVLQRLCATESSLRT